MAASLAFAGCGGNGVDNAKHGIPKSDAHAILTQLDQINSQFDHGACNGASAKVGELEARVNGLPRSVDTNLRRELVNGVRRLAQLVSDQCKRPTPTQTQTTTTPTQTTPPPTNTQTTPTETQPPPTQTQPAPTTTTPTPTTPGTGGTMPGNGNGNAGGGD